MGTRFNAQMLRQGEDPQAVSGSWYGLLPERNGPFDVSAAESAGLTLVRSCHEVRTYGLDFLLDCDFRTIDSLERSRSPRWTLSLLQSAMRSHPMDSVIPGPWLSGSLQYQSALQKAIGARQMTQMALTAMAAFASEPRSELSYGYEMDAFIPDENGLKIPFIGEVLVPVSGILEPPQVVEIGQGGV